MGDASWGLGGEDSVVVCVVPGVEADYLACGSDDAEAASDYDYGAVAAG